VLAVWPREEKGWDICPYYAFPVTWEAVAKKNYKPPMLYTKQFRVQNDEWLREYSQKQDVSKGKLKDAKNFYRDFELKYRGPFSMGHQGGI